MSALDLIMLVLLTGSALVFLIQMLRAALSVWLLVAWAAVFIVWVLISPWPLSAVTK